MISVSSCRMVELLPFFIKKKRILRYFQTCDVFHTLNYEINFSVNHLVVL